MAKILKLKDFDSALGLASLSTKKLIRASVPGAKNSFPELLSKYRFSGTRDFNMALIIIAFYNYCLRSDNAYIKQFAQGAARSGTISNQIFLNLAEGNGKEIKKCMSMQFEFALDAVLQEVLPKDEDKNEPKRKKVIKNFKTQAGKMKPWVTNGNEIKSLIKFMFGSAFDLKFKKKKITSARDAKKLLDAAKTGDYKTVLSLLETGINVNAKDDSDNTALMLAANEGHTKVVKFLLDHGADVNAENKNGYTALILAIEFGHTDAIKLLLKHGANVDAIDKDGYTALIWAIEFGRTDAIKLLLKHGANANVSVGDKYGNTALMVAAGHDYTEIAKLLLDHGADVNAENKNGYTALIWAIEFGRTDAIKLLLKQQGINVNAKNNYGYTALMKASEEGHTEIVKLLIKKDADVNVKNILGKTALDLAKNQEIKDLISNFKSQHP